MKLTTALYASCLAFGLLAAAPLTVKAADTAGTEVIKGYLVTQVTKMNAASHDFVTNAAAYNQIIEANGGDYNKAAIGKMQAD